MILSALLLFALLAAQPDANAAAKKRKRQKARPTPTAILTPEPPRFLRAAGACVRFEPGQYLFLAEMGERGRAFRIDGETSLEVTPTRGSRIRVFYVEGPDGPVARRVMPGPAPVKAPAH